MEADNQERKATCPCQRTAGVGITHLLPAPIHRHPVVYIWRSHSNSRKEVASPGNSISYKCLLAPCQENRFTASKVRSKAYLGDLLSLKGLACHLQCVACDYVPQELAHPKLKYIFKTIMKVKKNLPLETTLLLNNISHLRAFSGGLDIYHSDALRMREQKGRGVGEEAKYQGFSPQYPVRILKILYRL